MLKISNLTKSFGGAAVLKNIDLNVPEGEFLALLGPSGSGKTTLLRTIAGFEDADTGTIRIRDQVVVHNATAVAPERRRIGMVFQDYALFPHMSVRENVSFGLPRGRGRSSMVEHALEAVEMSPWKDSMPHELSGGQQQRIALARALAPEPGIVLLDEPFSNLDPALRAQVRSDVRRILHDAGVTAMLVTHDQEEALSIADRVAVLLDGEIAQIGTPREVYQQPSSQAVASFLGDAQFLEGVVEDRAMDTSFGTVTLRNEVPAGARVTALVRPEMVAIMPAGSSANADFRVRDIGFFGRDQRVVLESREGLTLVARIPADAAYRIGQEVSIRFNQPLHVISVENESGEA